MELYPSGQQSIYFKFSANKVNMVRFWALHKAIVVRPRNLWALLNRMFSDCLWRVSQSQKCVSSRIIQTYKNWAGSFGAAEQTTQGSGCLCKCYRLVYVIQHVHFLSLTGSLRCFSERLQVPLNHETWLIWIDWASGGPKHLLENLVTLFKLLNAGTILFLGVIVFIYRFKNK